MKTYEVTVVFKNGTQKVFKNCVNYMWNPDDSVPFVSICFETGYKLFINVDEILLVGRSYDLPDSMEGLCAHT